MNNPKKKVLILKQELSAYNTEPYNHIGQIYDLTIGYLTKDKSNGVCNFKKKKFETFKVGPFIFVKNLYKFCNDFDVVIFLNNLRIPSYCLIPYVISRPSLTWGIGFRVSYVHPYITGRKHNLLDYIYKKILQKCVANIFYMEKAKEFWMNTSLNLSTIFVAPNSTNVVNIGIDSKQRRNFLFVGRLYPDKGLDLLMDAYRIALQETKCDRKLIIVGEGEMRSWLENFIDENSLHEYVELKGAVYDEKELSKYFNQALLCISPSQAGLSVAKSMGYGVPFVTRKDAITGGELYHIHSSIDGIVYEKDQDLSMILVDAISNPDKYIEMGKKAKEYYDNNASPFHMAQGAIRAIEYALNNG